MRCVPVRCKEAPFCFPKRLVLSSETDRFRLQNGPFGKAVCVEVL